MRVTRRSILDSEDARDRYLAGVVELSRPDPQVTALDVYEQLREFMPWFRMFGQNQQLSMWDLFIIWHYVAMQLVTPPLARVRNLAHGGPVFLPWHRMFLIRLEEQLQRVTEQDAALPYWRWAAHGDQPAAQQHAGDLWSEACLGESRGEVTSGLLGQLRVRIEERPDGLWSIPERRLQRDAGNETAPMLPTTADVRWAINDPKYDGSGWDTESNSFRNKVEGWLSRPPTPDDPGQPGPQLHNRVHMWVGGDMWPGTSPNDPVFYLNHCNEDRIWEAWMVDHGRDYRPDEADADAPVGHRLNDTMVALLGQPLRPVDVLDPSAWYVYDDLSIG